MQSWIEANGVGLRYDLSGSGPTAIVLIHEMGGMLETWDEVAPVLATRRRVLRYDMRGAGLSERVRAAYRIEDAVADLAGVLDHALPGETVALAGVAVGAAVAIRFAADHPERALALVAMAPATGVEGERRTRLLESAARIEAEGIRPLVETSIMVRAFPPELRTNAARVARFRLRHLANDGPSYAAMQRMLAAAEFADVLPRVQCPTLVASGSFDQGRPPAMGRAVAAAIPGARFVEVASGHFMPAQSPELVAPLIEAFLAEHEL